MMKAAARAAAEYGTAGDAPSAAADGAEVRHHVPGIWVVCRTNTLQPRVHTRLLYSTRHAISVYDLVEAACR